MIFVTVGTHDQQFNRLVRFMDEWAKVHDEPVVIQTGCSTVEPRHSEWKDYYPYPVMQRYMEEARIVITHGGPSSFLPPLQFKKIPIVVPRRMEFHEHVNDHQVAFVKAFAERNNSILVIEDIEELGEVITAYPSRIISMNKETASNTLRFCEDFKKIVNELVR